MAPKSGQLCFFCPHGSQCGGAHYQCLTSRRSREGMQIPWNFFLQEGCLVGFFVLFFKCGATQMTCSTFFWWFYGHNYSFQVILSKNKAHFLSYADYYSQEDKPHYARWLTLSVVIKRGNIHRGQNLFANEFVFAVKLNVLIWGLWR